MNEYYADDLHLWGVAFCGSDTHFLSPILKKGFEHCFCFRECEGGILIMNYFGYRDDIRFEPMSLDEYAAFLSLSEHKVVVYVHKPVISMFYRMWFTCVSATLSKIGMRNRLVFTPYQLYNALIREGATEI